MVYLLHFNRRYRHAGHYLGYTTNLNKRLEQHRKGQGARLLEVIKGAGVGFMLVRTWSKGTRKLERRLKNGKNSPKLCPICNSKVKVMDVKVSNIVCTRLE